MFCASKNLGPQPSFLYLPHGFCFPHISELSHWNLYDTVSHNWEECTEKVSYHTVFPVGLLAELPSTMCEYKKVEDSR